MPDFFLKVGDTSADLVRVLEDVSGPVPLDGATVRFQMRLRESDTTKVDEPAVIDPDQILNAGKVSYSWVDGDVDTAGTYLGEFKVTFPSGKKATFPNGDDYIEILIGEGVDDEPAP